MTTKNKKIVWWLCWINNFAMQPTPNLLPGDDLGPTYLNEHDKPRLIKAVKIPNEQDNLAINSIVAAYPFEGTTDGRRSNAKSNEGTAPAS